MVCTWAHSSVARLVRARFKTPPRLEAQVLCKRQDAIKVRRSGRQHLRRAHGASKRLIGLPEKRGAQAEKDTGALPSLLNPLGLGRTGIAQKDQQRALRATSGGIMRAHNSTDRLVLHQRLQPQPSMTRSWSGRSLPDVAAFTVLWPCSSRGTQDSGLKCHLTLNFFPSDVALFAGPSINLAGGGNTRLY